MATAAELNFYYRQILAKKDVAYWQGLVNVHNHHQMMGTQDPNEGWLVMAMFNSTEDRMIRHDDVTDIRRAKEIARRYREDQEQRDRLAEAQGRRTYVAMDPGVEMGVALYDVDPSGTVHLRTRNRSDREKSMSSSVTFNVMDILRKEMEAQTFNSELETKRNLMHAYGLKDVWPNGTVISFKKGFNVANNRRAQLEKKEYHFVAVKSGDGLWYMTGPNHNPGGWDWATFVLWLIDGDFCVEAKNVYVMEQTARTMTALKEIEGEASAKE